MSKELLLRLLEEEHSRSQTERITQKVITGEIELNRIFSILHGSDPIIVQRAGWILSVLADDKPTLFSGRERDLLDLLLLQTHDAVHRGASKVLSRIHISEKYQSEAYDIAQMQCKDKRRGVACKVWSIDILIHVCELHPGLVQETLSTLNDMLLTNSSGLKRKVQKSIQKISGNFEKP